MAEGPRILMLDLLETLARERDMDVRLERNHDREAWTCALMVNRVGPDAADEATLHDGMQPDVCGSETVMRPFSYYAVIEDIEVFESVRFDGGIFDRQPHIVGDR